MTSPEPLRPVPVDTGALSSSFDDLDDNTHDQFTPYGRDPFDVVAAIEEELGEPLRRA